MWNQQEKMNMISLIKALEERKNNDRANTTHPRWREKSTGDFLFGGHDNPIPCQYSYAGSGVIDGFDRIFYLMKATFWRECGCGGIVAAGHFGKIWLTTASAR